MKKENNFFNPDTIPERIQELNNDPSPLARELQETLAAYQKLEERFDRVMGIADRYQADLMKTNEELVKSRDEIRKVNEAISQVNNKLKILSSITRHDILNRVMVTSFYSENVRDCITDEDLKKQLDAVKISSEEIKNIIQFTGLYQDLGMEAPAWQNIRNILSSPSIQNMISDITINYMEDSLEIYADRMLEKVIYNLVENSKRHGENLSKISFSCHKEGDKLVLLYEDDGKGVPTGVKEKIFEKGFGKNTGLGLFLIREILSITGITIIENGEPGVGVRFEITIPEGKFRINSK
ncbi:MAG: sensor histidine kinase [Methanomicrobiales archaeon]|nr:sensor histidine kinase [Methanomicrobiales archaeon]